MKVASPVEPIDEGKRAVDIANAAEDVPEDEASLGDEGEPDDEVPLDGADVPGGGASLGGVGAPDDEDELDDAGVFDDVDEPDDEASPDGAVALADAVDVHTADAVASAALVLL